MNIQPNRLDRGFYLYQREFEEKALEVLRSGWYILGNEVLQFEKEFAEYIETPYCVGVASGLDALRMAFHILGIGTGDEVIVPGNTYIASVMGVTMNDAAPVFVEPDDYYGMDASKIEEKITKNTKAILAVHLYGQSCNMESIVSLCKKYQLRLVEDCAQSHGARFQGQMTGTFGDIGCFSFYPSKNIGAFGDAGAIVTKEKWIADEMKVFRNYGSEKRYYNKVVGTNSRLDEIQAGLLRVRLLHAEELLAERTKLAGNYISGLHNNSFALPQTRPDASHAWHQFVIRCKNRPALLSYLEEKEIGTIIHYPIPPHLAEAYRHLGYCEGSFPITEQFANEVLSIPFYNGMTDEEQAYVIDALNHFS